MKLHCLSYRTRHGELSTIVLCVVGLALAVTAGCSTSSAPRVSVVDARVMDQSEEATVISIELELENRNSEPLPLSMFSYRLNVDGRRIFDGRRSAQATIPQHTRQRLAIPAVISHERFGGMPAGSLPCMISGRLTYVGPGELGDVLFDTKIYIPSVSFEGGVPVEFDGDDQTPESQLD